jgi:dipeptidyl aminopeptidase/acylaminoacyl peptidase
MAGARWLPIAGPVAVLGLLAGCTESSPAADEEPSPSAAATETETATESPTAEPSRTEEPEPAETLPPVNHPISLPALMGKELGPTRIVRRGLLGTADAYTRHAVTYRSGGLTVSGVLLVPSGKGPFPGIVLNHGYINPSIYVTGQGLAREQDWLARAGFVVLHTDYRGHAASDPTPPLDRESRLGYAEDAINAVRALKKEPYVDADRMAMLGRSMGGGVTLDALVARPGLVDAAVVYASVSSRFLDNLNHFTVPNRPEAAQAMFARFGTPQESPRFYRELSPRTFFDRITEPVLMHHGTNDESCPFPWATTTHRLLREAGVNAQLEVYPGEMHSFVPRWQDSIERTVQFLRRQMDA